MAGRIIHAKFDIGEVFENFAVGLKAPEGHLITRATPHYDPRQGTVIFECYVEPVTLTIPADQSYPAASLSKSDL